MPEDNDPITMTIEVVASYVAHNNMRPDDPPGFIAQTHAAIIALNAAPEPEADVAEADAPPEYQPATTARKSLASRDHILSMIDGKPYKTLKRHIAEHGMTPAEYRERYGLKADYPMTAPAYSEHRREVAKTLGLGRKSAAAAKADASPEAAGAKAATAKSAVDGRDAQQPAKRRGRPPKSVAPVEAPVNDEGQD